MPRKISAKSELENPQRIEPALLDGMPSAVADAVAALAGRAASLGNALHPRTAESLAQLVRIMNAYYSNLIEGHNTRPRDIARALEGALDDDEGRRNLQLEAAAHVRVQAMIDERFAAGELPATPSRKFLEWLHLGFYRGAPIAMLRVRRDNPAYVMRP